jgi:hypothetical protein
MGGKRQFGLGACYVFAAVYANSFGNALRRLSWLHSTPDWFGISLRRQRSLISSPSEPAHVCAVHALACLQQRRAEDAFEQRHVRLPRFDAVLP